MRLIDERGRLFGKLNLLDGIALFLLLFASALTFHLVGHDFLRHTTLTIELVEPKQYTPGVDEFLSVSGNAFGQSPDIWIDSSDPLMSFQVNEARVDLKPPEGLTPGMPVVSVRNPRGRVVSVQGLFEVVWKPVATSIALLESGNQNLYLLSGDYLEPNCKVNWNGETLPEVVIRSRYELEVSAPAADVPLTRLVLQNPSGGITMLEGKNLLEELRPKTADADWVPQVERLIPSAIRVERDSDLVVVGTHFAGGCTVRVGDHMITNVTLVKPYLLAVRIPARSLPFGRYPIEVTNPNGKTALFRDGLMVQEEALAEMVLRFDRLSKDQIKWFRQSPITLQILSERPPRRERLGKQWIEEKGRIEIRGLLPVLRENIRGDLSYSAAKIPLLEGEFVQVQVLPDQTLPAVLMSSPKLVQRDQ